MMKGVPPATRRCLAVCPAVPFPKESLCKRLTSELGQRTPARNIKPENTISQDTKRTSCWSTTSTNNVSIGKTSRLFVVDSPQVLWCQKILCSYSLAVLSKTTAQTSKGEPGPSAHSLIPALLFVLPPSLDREPRAPEGFSMLLWTGGSIKSMSGSGEANGSHFRTTDRMALSEVRKQETSNHVILYVHDPISILWVVLEHVFFLSGSLALHQRRLDVAFTLHFSIELVSIRPNPSNQPQTPSQKVGRSVDPFG